MTKQELTNDFIDWVETKTQSEFTITNGFLLVCLDAEIENYLSSNIDGVPFIDYFEKETNYKSILSSWKNNAISFLSQPTELVKTEFLTEQVPTTREYREKLIFQLSQLALKCEDSQQF